MNKILSKIISLFLAVVLTVGIVSVNTVMADAETFANGDWQYSISELNGLIIIDGYTGTDPVVTVPSDINGKAVTEIGAEAFYRNTTITEVTVPSSVKTIRVDAFTGCGSLETVNLSEGLTEIHASFKETAIESITIPSTVKYLSEDAFAEGAVKEIIIEAEYASLLSMWHTSDNPINEETEIVFKGIPKVSTDLSLRNKGFDSYRKDGDYCYRPDYSGETPQIHISGDYTYTLDSGNATIIRCKNFTDEEIVIPDTLDGYPVTAIGDFAFSAASAVGSSFGNTTITYTYAYTKITLPEGVETIGRYAFAENKNLKEVVLPESVSNFNYCAFMNCKNLESVNIPDGIEHLPDFLFSGCAKLKNLELPDSVKIICDNAVSITSADSLPAGVEYLGKELFAGCTEETVTLPENLKVLRGTFYKMQTLKQVEFNESLKEIGEKTFQNCNGLTGFSVPDSVKILGNSAFQNCANLTKVYMSVNVTHIPFRAFMNCTSLAEFEWYAEKQTVEDSAFRGCPLLSFDFSKSQGIDYGAFSETDIEKAKIGQPEYEEGLKISIGAQSFMSCSELQTVALGGNVDEIGSKAFADCANLQTVVISDSVERIAEDAFDGSENVTIYCFADSYAETFAIENKIRVTTLVISPIPNQTYTTKKIEPELTVMMSSQQLGKNEYSVEYYNNINVGTADVIVSGKGDLDMLVSKAEFAIVAKNISNLQISHIPTQYYDNSAAIKPDVTVKYNGVKLKKGTDYTLSYEDNHNVGTATVKIKGIGNYKGTATVNFEIVDEEDSLITRFFNAIADFFRMAWNWFIGLFK